MPLKSARCVGMGHCRPWAILFAGLLSLPAFSGCWHRSPLQVEEAEQPADQAAQSPPPVPGAAGASAAQEPPNRELQQIVTESIAAHGGEAAIEKLRSGRTTIAVQGEFAPGVKGQGTFVDEFQLPRQFRRVAEFTIDGQPRKAVFGFDGQNHWVQLPDGTVRDVPAGPTIEDAYPLKIIRLLADLASGDYVLTKISSEGTESRDEPKAGEAAKSESATAAERKASEEAGGKEPASSPQPAEAATPAPPVAEPGSAKSVPAAPPADAIAIRVQKDDVWYGDICFDRQRKLIVRYVKAIVDPSAKQPLTIDTRFSDFQQLHSLTMPTTVTILRDNQPWLQLTIKEFEQLDKIDERVFSKP
jgi:hypothetical protein